MQTSQTIESGIDGDTFAEKLDELKAHIVDYCERAKTTVSNTVVMIELNHNSDGSEVEDTLKVSIEDNAVGLERELVMEIDL